MKKRLLLWLIERLYRATLEPITADKVNKKMVRPVAGLLIDGVQYYEFVHASDMPQGRLVHYNYLREELAMGIDRELLKQYIEELKAANTSQDTNRIGSVLYMLEDTICNVTSIESLYNLASLWFFTLDEDLSTYDLAWNQRKIEAFKRFPDKGFFFGQLLRMPLKGIGVELPSDIQRFLNANAAKLAAYSRILTATKSGSTS